MNFFGIASVLLFLMIAVSSWYAGRQKRRGQNIALLSLLMVAEFVLGSIFFSVWAFTTTLAAWLVIVSCFFYLIATILSVLALDVIFEAVKKGGER